MGRIVNAGAAGANSSNVFPNTSDVVGALAANAAFALPVGKVVTFYCGASGFWSPLLSA